MDNTTLPVSIREQWPWRPRFARVSGWRMHYVDEGTGDPVVLLHGNPTWGFLYRDFVEPLTSAGHRVVIPDMIGLASPRSLPGKRRIASTGTSPT
jgi:pimeloyl-ACP methyl ester carboxylesterase